MRINNEPIIATSFLTKESDLKNQCFLSRDTIFIKYRGKMEDFRLEYVNSIQFKHKMLMFPLIIGGIIAPLSGLALLNDFGNPWLLLSALIGGLLFVYLGYEGSPTLTISTKVKDYDFFIYQPTPSLKAFVKYARQLVYFGEKGYFFYFTLSEQEQQHLSEKNEFNLQAPKRLCYYEEVFNKKEDFFAVEPVRVSSNFSLEANNDQVIPTLKGTIKVEDIIQPDS